MTELTKKALPVLPHLTIPYPGILLEQKIGHSSPFLQRLRSRPSTSFRSPSPTPSASSISHQSFPASPSPPGSTLSTPFSSPRKTAHNEYKDILHSLATSPPSNDVLKHADPPWGIYGAGSLVELVEDLHFETFQNRLGFPVGGERKKKLKGIRCQTLGKRKSLENDMS
uniref:Uncharacterized protein n=1 Tax=Corethron hystrix TaxID=216773 RepID=A0A7S1B4M8_9STRA|mmetsp:Transcript_12162/g.26625  ORF Transcript_12162/g.26625 Transcript_12162/m.26625 type:complete len:169 (+) Transcript_12162:134-640(+)